MRQGVLIAVALWSALALAAPPAKSSAPKKAAATDAGTAIADGAPGPEVLPPPANFVWDIPGVVQAVEVPGQQITNGVPVKFDAFLSSWTIEALADHFVRAFADAGLFIPPPDQQMKVSGMLQLTALDPGRMVSYTVILRPAPDKKNTVVIAAQAGVASWNAHPEVADIAPAMPGAQGIVRSTGEGMASFSYKVTATAEEVQSFYRAVMRANGFEEKEAGIYKRGGEEITVRANAEGQGAMGVLVTRRGGPPSERLPPPAVAPSGKSPKR